MKRLVSIILTLCLLFILTLGSMGCSAKPNRVHVYGNIILTSSTYIKGNVCFEISDYQENNGIKQVKIKRLERYGWITIYNGDLYASDKSCPYCGYNTAIINY